VVLDGRRELDRAAIEATGMRYLALGDGGLQPAHRVWHQTYGAGVLPGAREGGMS
jgi:hypothetical protein